MTGLGVLRLTTCGAVDDGKSTLLGRLLLDSHAVFEDQRLSLPRGGDGEPDAALLFDGLDAEREQSITIDVAYRYFETARRKFVIADAPGHEAHTRNMATAASNADVAIIVVDVLKGPSAQTFRHIRIAGLVGVKAAIIAINKMDAANFADTAFEAAAAPVRTACDAAGLCVVATLPVSAKTGANIVTARAAREATLLGTLETLDLQKPNQDAPFRMPVQMVVKPQAGLEARGYAGTIAAGAIAVGDFVRIAHWGQDARLTRIVTAEGDLARAVAGQSVTLCLDGEYDIARGDLLACPQRPPIMSSRIEADLIGLAEQGAALGRSYDLRCGARAIGAQIVSLSARETFGATAGADLAQNEIARATLTLSRPIALDPFNQCRDTGGFLLVDRHSGETVAAGMVTAMTPTHVQARRSAITPADRAAMMGHKPAVVWFTGLSGAGKSTIAELVEQLLHARGVHTFALDGDNLRSGLTKDLGFSASDRLENIRRASEAARLFVEAGLIVTCAFISPFRMDRALARDLIGAERFLEVFVDTSLETCIARDPKGLYVRALKGEIKEFSGVSSPYEAPLAPDLHLAAGLKDPAACAQAVITLLRTRALID
jgi:bifunctional enzyme CysN/CysC